MAALQDFVRMDPSYTPDIEHLVFPSRKRNPQQVAPAIIQSSASKTRSRLAEMFALSRHLQQRSADRETSKSTRKASAAVAINVSIIIDFSPVSFVFSENERNLN